MNQEAHYPKGRTLTSGTMSQLNEQQEEAVETTEGPLLVLAGAGSGKTRVVTERIKRIIQKGNSPRKILGLTFTNKAAEEMKERVHRATNAHVLICTFHSLGARILRESAHHLGYRPDFSIYDADDSDKLLKGCLEHVTFSKKSDFKTIRSLISKCKNEMIPPEEIDLTELSEDASRHFLNAYMMYQARLKESGALDFDDLLYLTVQLLHDFPNVLEMYQERWEYLLIDEYQDTNNAQYTMIQMLASKRQNICVVGDPDQSIYSWRGATIANILNFERDYQQAKVITLDQNYRSTSTILNAANAVINNNPSQYEKHLWSDLGDGEKITLFKAYDEREEAQYVVDKVNAHQRRGISLDDMVVFYRTNFQSRAFEDALIYNGIPYVIVGGISFYHRREVKDVLSILRVVQTGADMVGFARTVNLPKRGIGPTTIEKLRNAAVANGMPILDACVAAVNGELSGVKLSAKQKASFIEYIHAINHIRDIASTGTLKDIVAAAVYDTSYLDVLRLDPETYDDRKANLDELISKAAEWETISEETTLASFLSELALKTTLDESTEHQETLKLMTVHNAKGLEFDVAFLVGMEEELFPHVNSQGSDFALEEERRLCYVGITRARKHLYITRARFRFMWGMQKVMRKSRFLDEIPEKYVEFEED